MNGEKIGKMCIRDRQAQKGMLSEVLVKEQIGILAQKIQVLKNENKEIREHSQDVYKRQAE